MSLDRTASKHSFFAAAGRPHSNAAVENAVACGFWLTRQGSGPRRRMLAVALLEFLQNPIKPDQLNTAILSAAYNCRFIR